MCLGLYSDLWIMMQKHLCSVNQMACTVLEWSYIKELNCIYSRYVWALVIVWKGKFGEPNWTGCISYLPWLWPVQFFTWNPFRTEVQQKIPEKVILDLIIWITVMLLKPGAWGNNTVCNTFLIQLSPNSLEDKWFKLILYFSLTATPASERTFYYWRALVFVVEFCPCLNVLFFKVSLLHCVCVPFDLTICSVTFSPPAPVNGVDSL
jgi:hypothetical protein